MNHEPDFLVCPLLSAGQPAAPVPCKGACCAWWHTYRMNPGSKVERCALVSIADNLGDMNQIGVRIYI